MKKGGLLIYLSIVKPCFFRFFCPPPYICLTGNGWKRKEQQLNEFKFTQSCSPMSGVSNIGKVQLIATIGIGKPTEQREEQLQFTEQDDKFKVLHNA